MGFAAQRGQCGGDDGADSGGEGVGGGELFLLLLHFIFFLFCFPGGFCMGGFRVKTILDLVGRKDVPNRRRLHTPP